MRTKLLRPKEYWLDLPIHNLPTLKSYTRDHLKDLRLLTVGDLVKRCINKKKEYNPIDRKGFGVASNYDVAKLLHRQGFLSEAAFAKVKLPDWNYRKLTDEEIGEMKDVLVSKFPWSETAQLVIIYVASIGHRRYTNAELAWAHMTVGKLVKRFVRVTSYGQTILWERGHIHWYHQAALRAFRECLPEIEKFLYDNYFLERREETKPAEDEP